jgi:hypothetical protein
MIVKTIARRMGLNPSSNGQLMKTDLEAGGLAVGRFATRLLGLAPQRIEEGLGGGRTLAAYRGDLDSAVHDRPLGLGRGTDP